jgi:hypothetical protein
MTRWFTRMAAVVVAGLAATTSAKADIELALAEDAGARMVIATGPSFMPLSAPSPFTFGDFTISVFGGSAINGGSLSSLLSSTTQITNNSGATHTLHLWVTQTGYTTPAGTPLIVESGLAGTQNNGTVGLSGIFQAYVDKNNNLFGTSDFTNGPQNASLAISTFDTGSALGSFSRTDSNPYSVTSVANFSLTGGGVGNYSDHVNLTPTPVVPAPPALFLVGAAVPVLALRRWYAKRKAVAAA